MFRECTKAEWKVLELLWKQEGQTDGQIARQLQAEAGWTPGAVRALLSRLEQKQLIGMEETAGTKRYVCKIPREQVSIAPWGPEKGLLKRIQEKIANGRRGKRP